MTTDIAHPLAPSLGPVFSGAIWRAADPYRRNSRELFYGLMHLSEHEAVYPAAYGFIKQRLAELHPFDSVLLFNAEQDGAVRNEPTCLTSPSGVFEINDQPLQTRLLQCSPVILTEPCWLQSISQAAASQNPMAIDLMAVYLTLTREGNSRDEFRALLLSSGLELPPISSRMFAEQESVPSCLFDFAALQLALASFPRVFFPEILGFTLAYCRSDSPLLQVQPRELNPHFARYIKISEWRRSSVLPDVSRIIDAYLNAFSDQTDELRLRIESGYRLYRKQIERCHRHFYVQRRNPTSPSDRWAKLLKKKASSAVGHHRNIKLAGRSLDDWFAQSPFDSAGFLSALKQSSYIDQAHPLNSRLLRLFDFHGPMFGVLNDEETIILENWLNAEPDAALTELPDIEENAPGTWAADEPSDTAIPFLKLNNRELYYYLVNADLYPEVLAAARNKVHKVLRSARRFNRVPFLPYSHQAFDNHIDALYQREVGNYQPVESKPKFSKEAYVWGIEQFAPAILTDGCWLQNIKHIDHGSNRTLVALLFKIYQDEIGNGKLEQNHPFIYQQLLNSVGLNLPPIASRQFIEYPGFIDSAFDLPVYLLSISKFPSAFLPELLGVNMAIELSGLGNAYLRLSEELTYWGIDPAIVDIHISIDNVSSGHAYLAKNAIQIYLDAIAVNSGNAAVQSQWRRICDGYCSLQSVCRGFTFALISRYLFNRFTKKAVS